MKNTLLIIIPALLLVACGGPDEKETIILIKTSVEPNQK